MPEIICITFYQFPELSDAAKERARSWYRNLGPHDDWWDAVYEDFERVRRSSRLWILRPHRWKRYGHHFAGGSNRSLMGSSTPINE